jgi:alkanal monooxygenase alpha chain
VELTPRPSIHVAAESPTSVEWAAKHGFLLLMQLVGDYEELAARIELYSEFAESAEHEPESIEHVVICLGHIASSKEQAKAELIDIMEWWGEES